MLTRGGATENVPQGSPLWGRICPLVRHVIVLCPWPCPPIPPLDASWHCYLHLLYPEYSLASLLLKPIPYPLQLSPVTSLLKEVEAIKPKDYGMESATLVHGEVGAIGALRELASLLNHSQPCIDPVVGSHSYNKGGGFSLAAIHQPPLMAAREYHLLVFQSQLYIWMQGTFVPC